MNFTNISIGIPVLNEQENIGVLLTNLLKQVESKVKIDKIIVVSDGSDDQTVAIVKEFRDDRILLIDEKQRLGKAVRLNQIIALNKSSILILLDGDISIKDEYFLQKITFPIVNQNIDLTSTKLQPAKPVNFMEKILFYSINMKDYIFESYKSGNNVYTCHGAVRALSKKLFEDLTFKESIGEDAYLYLYCVKNGFRYKYVKDTFVYFRLPNNFIDHKKQSLRFLRSQKILKTYFGEKFTNDNYRLPLTLKITSIVRFLVLKPIYSFSYFLIFNFLKFEDIFSSKQKSNFEIAKSSKRI